ncbi:MAG: septal ring lytic transglycosylase RlpA family protein [Gammaproteobacteria bacterium]|nr:septal ring lytic transglycosylase RlpA family protein [Gammaproteobacteria bacterium]
MQPKHPNKPPFHGSIFVVLAIFGFIMMVGGCVHPPSRDGAPKYYIDVSKIHSPVPHYLPKSKYGNPSHYTVDGRRYDVLKSAHGYDKRGIASWYGTKFDGKLTSTRERYSLTGMTAASPDLPIPCYVRVTNLQNGKQVIVKVNDRGPFAANRVMDLSYVAAKKLGYEGRGTALVEVTSIDMPNPLEQKTNPVYREQRQQGPELFLQVAAFSNLRNAKSLEYRLKHLTSRPIRIIHDTPHSRLYRVQIGPLKNVTETDELQRRIYHAHLGHALTVIN